MQSPFETCSANQYNTIQYITIQYNTIPYNTIPYNTIQYNTTEWWSPEVYKGHASSVKKTLARGFFYPEEEGETLLRNVGSHKIYMAPHPRSCISSTNSLLCCSSTGRLRGPGVLHLPSLGHKDITPRNAINKMKCNWIQYNTTEIWSSEVRSESMQGMRSWTPRMIQNSHNSVQVIKHIHDSCRLFWDSHYFIFFA
jgi:hypothetical protein